MKNLIILLLTLLITNGTYAQQIKLVEGNLVANKVYMSTMKYQGKAVVKVIKDSTINEWTKMKIIVKGNQAKLFLNNNKQPSFIVSDLKVTKQQNRYKVNLNKQAL